MKNELTAKEFRWTSAKISKELSYFIHSLNTDHINVEYGKLSKGKTVKSV